MIAKNSDHPISPIPPSTTLLQLRAGKIAPLGTHLSAIHKSRQLNPVTLTALGVPGDQQQYAAHGGIDKALHWYCADRYLAWKKIHPSSAHLFKPGGFGENIVAEGLNEENVCIGDMFSVGDEVLVQVSEPRQPCYKLNVRFEWEDASREVQRRGWTGWYLRVLKPGIVKEGDLIELVERQNPRWSIASVSEILYNDISNEEALRDLAGLPELGLEIKQLCEKRLRKKFEDQEERLRGSMPQRVWWKCKLIRKKKVTRSVISLQFGTVLDGEDGGLELGPFAHVRLKYGPDDCFTRAYSVVGGTFSQFELGVALDKQSTGGSRYLHEELKEGDVVETAHGIDVHSPVTTLKEGWRHLFIIGGIGVTAFLRRLESLQGQSADYETHYAVRGDEIDAAYFYLLDSSKTKMYYSAQRQRLNVEEVITADCAHSQRTIICCCGPPSLTAAVRTRCQELKWPPSLIHFEDFGSEAGGEPFQAEIRSDRGTQEIEVSSTSTLLQAARLAGLEVPSSCESGSCGMCKIRYLEGEVVHRGVALSEEEKGVSMLSCVSRGVGKVLIEW